MKINVKENKVILAGWISQANIRTGQYGPFGHVTIAVDDSYRDTKNNNQIVERTQFIMVEVSGKKLPDLRVGDGLSVEGKLVYEPASNAQGAASILKVKVRDSDITSHIPKACLELLKNAGMYGKQSAPAGAPRSGQNNDPQGGQHHAPQGGYASAPQGNWGDPGYSDDGGYPEYHGQPQQHQQHQQHQQPQQHPQRPQHPARR